MNRKLKLKNTMICFVNFQFGSSQTIHGLSPLFFGINSNHKFGYKNVKKSEMIFANLFFVVIGADGKKM